LAVITGQFSRASPLRWARLPCRTHLRQLRPPAIIGAATDPLRLLSDILQLAVRHKASDIHLRTRAHPIMRVDGVLRAIPEVAPLPSEFMERLSRTIMSARLIAEFDRNHQADLSIGFKDIGRVRANVLMQRGSIAMVLRVINTQIPGIQDLGLPEMIRKFAQLESGLVLVTGATGSGMSTTLAALVNKINQTQNTHVVTIEYPIEFLFTEKKSIITQRVDRDPQGHGPVADGIARH
jgi:twitching motility protein PilT